MAKPPEIKPLSQEDKIAALLIGHPSSGKSTVIGTGAEAGMKILLVRSPLDHVPARILNSGAEQWVVSNWDDMNEVMDYTRHEGNLWDWVWLDSISLVQDMLLQSMWDDLIERKPHRAEYGPDKGEYGVNMWRLAQWVRHMVAAQETNIGITAIPFETDNPFNDEGGRILMPWVQGRAMPEKICGMMTFIGHLEVKQGKENTRWRRLHTQATEDYYAKDQYDAFPSGRLDNPTLPKIVDAIAAAKRGQKSTTTRTQRGGRRGAAPPARGRRGARAA
jgi:hypothetical protein